MIRLDIRWVAGLVLFIGVLLYATMVSMPDSPPTGVDHNALDAAAECESSVEESTGEADFPFSATVTYLGDARYRTSGVVEVEMQNEAIRRNYECFVHYTESGTYRTDSLTVWQSH